MYAVENILACIVIYEQPLINCTTLRSLADALLEKQCLEVVLYDNSKIATTDLPAVKTSMPGLKFHYMHDPTNPGVSRAYNEAAKIAIGSGKQWLIFFDQDTVVNKFFFREILDKINEHPEINLFCPAAFLFCSRTRS